VALNCVSNQKISEFFQFKEIYVQPAAGDAGGAMGAALDVWYSLHPDRSKKISELSSTFLGAEYAVKDMALALDKSNLVYEKVESMSELANLVGDHILEDKIVGLFQGRAEFGPRALGNRSILGNAFSSDIQTKLNLNIKFRESFRPFAPAVLQEDFFDIFDSKQINAFMLFTAKVKDKFFDKAKMDEMEGLKKLNVKRSLFQAVVHVDGTSRYQSVNADNNLFLHSILEYIKMRKGYGIVANTSFNVRGEPIVNSPEDAINCFKNTNMDFLVIGPFIISRKINNLEEIREKLDSNYD
jgi:carbamoyltransferase